MRTWDVRNAYIVCDSYGSSGGKYFNGPDRTVSGVRSGSLGVARGRSGPLGAARVRSGPLGTLGMGVIRGVPD